LDTVKLGDTWIGEDTHGQPTTYLVTWVGEFTSSSGETFTTFSLDNKPAAHIEWWFGQGYSPMEEQ
jgi:hypothetical protein